MSTSTFLAVVAMLLCGALSMAYSRFVTGAFYARVFGLLTIVLIVLATTMSIVEAFG